MRIEHCCTIMGWRRWFLFENVRALGSRCYGSGLWLAPDVEMGIPHAYLGLLRCLDIDYHCEVLQYRAHLIFSALSGCFFVVVEFGAW